MDGAAVMYEVTIHALTMPPSPMFRRCFTHPVLAEEYADWARAILPCHVRTQVRPLNITFPPQAFLDCTMIGKAEARI